MQFVVGRSVLQKELAFVQGVVERKNTIPVLANILIESAGENSIRVSGTDLDVLIPRKTLAELTKLSSDFDGDISLGADDNHVYFQVGSRLLISRLLTGQFPNYEMVMPKNNDRSAVFDTIGLNQAIRRVALMADERSHVVRFHLSKEQLVISSQNAEEGEAREAVATDYAGEDTEIGFNAQYLQDFLNVLGSEKVVFEFKDGNSQAQLRPVTDEDHDYRYIIMPMRL